MYTRSLNTYVASHKRYQTLTCPAVGEVIMQGRRWKRPKRGLQRSQSSSCSTLVVEKSFRLGGEGGDGNLQHAVIAHAASTECNKCPSRGVAHESQVLCYFPFWSGAPKEFAVFEASHQQGSEEEILVREGT